MTQNKKLVNFQEDIEIFKKVLDGAPLDELVKQYKIKLSDVRQVLSAVGYRIITHYEKNNYSSEEYTGEKSTYGELGKQKTFYILSGLKKFINNKDFWFRQLEHMQNYELVNNPYPSESILAKKLGDCGLSLRTFNCLQYDSHTYLGDLVRTTPEEIIKIPGFGQGCLQEVCDILASHGLQYYWKKEYIRSSFTIRPDDNNAREIVEIWLKSNLSVLGQSNERINDAQAFVRK